MIAAAVCAAATAVLVGAEARQAKGLRAVAKTLASTAFLVAAWEAGSLAAGLPGVFVGAALGMSMVGDLCLLSRQRPLFLAGLAAFLVGHVLFVAAFVSMRLSPIATALAAVPFGAVAWVVWGRLRRHVGTMKRPVAAYVFVITAMVCSAVGVAAADPTPARLGILAAAVMFFCSDLCVARDRFVAPGWTNKLVGLPLYYGAQITFALTTAAVFLPR